MKKQLKRKRERLADLLDLILTARALRAIAAGSPLFSLSEILAECRGGDERRAHSKP